MFYIFNIKDLLSNELSSDIKGLKPSNSPLILQPLTPEVFNWKRSTGNLQILSFINIRPTESTEEILFLICLFTRCRGIRIMYGTAK